MASLRLDEHMFGHSVLLGLGRRWIQNRYIPWATRTAFSNGIHEVNGLLMEIPRPPDWGGGGEFHMALGTYELGELRELVRRLRAGDVFLDVGAHIGYFTLPAAKCVGPAGRVIAIEPTPSSMALLRRNAALNGLDWITTVEAAATSRDGTAPLIHSSLSPMWNRLARDDADQTAVTKLVQTVRLDSVVAAIGWPKVAGIKIDAEDAGRDILDGAEEVLARNRQAFVVLEVSGQDALRLSQSVDLLRWLEAQGYRFRRMTIDGTSPLMKAEQLLPVLMRGPRWQDSLLNVLAER